MVTVSNPPAIEQAVQAIEAAVKVPEGSGSIVNRFLSTRRDQEYSL